MMGFDDPRNWDDAGGEATADKKRPRRIVTVSLEIQGARSVVKLAAKLGDIAGVVSVNAGDENIPSD
jgi:hypothetical protein